MTDQNMTTAATGSIDSISSETAVVDGAMLAGKVHETRGQKVMLDFDLAEIYGYSTKAFNQQVQRNIEKFDSDFRFQLTSDEWEILRSQFVTSRWGGSRYLPYAFTEQGVYMLMTVLKGDLATRQSKALIRLFKRMKDRIEEGRDLVGRREFLELSTHVSKSFAETLDLRRELRGLEADVAALVDEMGEVVHDSEIGAIIEDFGTAIERRGYLLMDGRPVEAAAAYAEIYGRARESIVVVDNYPGARTLALLASAGDGVRITLVTDNKARKLRQSDVDAFRSEYSGIELEIRSAGGFIHDRYIALDFGAPGESLFHCGGSSKDAGGRVTSILQIEETALYHAFVKLLFEQPPLDLP